MMPSKVPIAVAESVLLGQQGLPGEWILPSSARGVVVFSHCAGSRRQGARNHHVAELFQSRGLGTLLFDLPNPEQTMDPHPEQTIRMLAEQVQEAMQWLQGRADAQYLPMGIFSSSTGTAAALLAAAGAPGLVRAIVSRSGRPDMASGCLADVRAPTLLIVGAKDPYVLKINRACQQAMTCVTALHVVPRATSLFEEVGTLESVATLAGDWFLQHFSQPADVTVDEMLLRR